MFLDLSTKASIKNRMPMVIRENKSEGGYFVTFMKDKKVNTAVFCEDQGTGSPYILIKRRVINKNKAMKPSFINKLFLFSASNSKNFPEAKPTSIIPNQGIGG